MILKRASVLQGSFSLAISFVTLAAGVSISTDAPAQYYPPRQPRPVVPGMPANPVPPVNSAPPVIPVPRGRGIVLRPPRANDADDIMAEILVRRAAERLDCSGLGLMVRDVSNQILEATSQPDVPLPPARPGDPAAARRRMLQKIRQRMRSPGFLRAMWTRLAEAYSGCDRGCFEEGDAIGQISGAGYCAAVIGLNGLPDPGYQLQPLLPLCNNLQSVGCQNGFYHAAQTVPSCYAYTTGEYGAGFQHTVSQDCYMQ